MITTNYQMPEKVQLDENNYSNTFGRFILQPLEKGFGVTIGNAFRRVLLSSLSGTAFTAIRIEGVLHEFSTITGVVEDVSEIILNLKAVRLKLINKKLNRLVVELKGPKDFTAADIQKANPEIEILNPNQHIATLNAGSSFEMELRIGRGKGYVAAEDNTSPDQTAGLIAIDSIFTPIKNVRYLVETTRVGQQTDYEKLILEIETDGSIAPDDALAQAANILRDHIQLFLSFDIETEAHEEALEKDSEFARIRKILQMNVDELELSVRSHNCLRAANIKTIADLVRRDEPELLKFRNFGRKSLAELSEIIEQFGLSFGMDVDKYLHNGND
ncbi:MAG: DNA-directed RNA polymerase subunit alpha [Ignavibacteria bacterium]|nr:DNA-directed RNA polymerase subunit alpha [Ignavibacteria bacterium]MBI3766074.1 DNA-directed RNA polymerase subunit alpha [Ignavibacteriales bacterium]